MSLDLSDPVSLPQMNSKGMQIIEPAMSPISVKDKMASEGGNSEHPLAISEPTQGGSGVQEEVQIKKDDMNEEMKAKAIELAREAIAKETSPRAIAGHVKKAFDQAYGPAWHCIVGRSFGSFVTHEAHCFIFFYLGQWAIMLFKTA